MKLVNGQLIEETAEDQARQAADSADEASLARQKEKKQRALDDLLDNQFDLVDFIRAGSSTSITGTNVGNFLSSITNNYRTKRAAIAAAADLTALSAVNLATGWPSNP